MSTLWTRRSVLAAAGFGLAAAAGVELVRRDALGEAFVRGAEDLTLRTHRLLLAKRPLVREFTMADLSAHFPVNGSRVAPGDAYQRLVDTQFTTWRLKVHGLVQRSLSLSLEDLRRLAARSQITMHCCDEGWSAIGQWSGVPLGLVLSLAGLSAGARYVVFHCLDRKDENKQNYYESLDLIDAYHPQTILAYDMNGKPLPVPYGAPLRLRVETQIGYKNAKFIDRIEVVDTLNRFGRGRGGWWEDFDNAVWYAGQ